MGNLDFSANADQLKELAAFMASQINVPTIGIGGGYAPIGTIIPLMGTTVPQDYLACDGTVYNIADYPQLADYFESQFGESNHFGGNGTTTFAVPDLQGEFLRGTGTNSHTNQGSGANVGVHQDSTIFPDLNGASAVYISNIGPDNTRDTFDASYTTTRRIAGGSQDNYGKIFTARPTNTSVLYCIKAVVAGEVYSTEERVVGTWIDGKKLYQKSIEITQIPNKQLVTIDHNIANIDRITDIKGICFAKLSIDSNYASSLMPRIQDNTTIDNMSVDINRVSVMVKGRGTNFSDIYDKIVVTIQYTKTTDG